MLVRGPNDVIWMKGNTPLMFVLMAISSLLFGGLHCLAWNFEFPSRAELILWRVASLTSAILPVVALVASLFLNYFSTKYIESRPRSTIITKLRPLEQLPDKWWQNVIKPTFDTWSHDQVVALMSSPKESRNWKQPPSIQVINEAKASEEWDNADTAYGRFNSFHLRLRALIDLWAHALEGKDTRGELIDIWEFLFPEEMIEDYRKGLEFEFWHDYEAYLRHEMAIPAAAISHGSCTEDLLLAHAQAKSLLDGAMKPLSRACTLASTLLTLCSGIIYACARLAIVVLLFTSLRSVPEGVYLNTPWTRFLPNIS